VHANLEVARAKRAGRAKALFAPCPCRGPIRVGTLRSTHAPSNNAPALKERPLEDDEGNAEVDDEPGDVDQRRDERCRSAGGVKPN
jgi:hypothetical protein